MLLLNNRVTTIVHVKKKWAGIKKTGIKQLLLLFVQRYYILLHTSTSSTTATTIKHEERTHITGGLQTLVKYARYDFFDSKYSNTMKLLGPRKIATTTMTTNIQ